MHNDQSSYSRWSWIVAIILFLILLALYLTGSGPKQGCCGTTTPTEIAKNTAPTEISVVSEAFSFTASENEFTGVGDATNITWVSDIDALKALLSGNLTAEGDELTVTLNGEVESEEAKQEKEVNAQAFFGPDVTIVNNISVSMPAVIETPPDVAKLYFDTGVHRLPSDGTAVLEATIAWLSEHPEAKAIISGFHDATGDLASNQRLAKKRAESAYNALITAGISADRIEMRKPESTEGEGDLSEARRVEVSIE